MGMRLQKRYKVPQSNFAPQTVRELLQQKRQHRTALGQSATSQLPAGSLEANQTAKSLFQEPPGGTERGGGMPGQPAAPQYPLTTFPAWPSDAPSQLTFSSDYHYPCADKGKSYFLAPPETQYGMMSPFSPLETAVYGPTGSGAAESLYSPKMVPAADFEKAATEAQALSLYPGPRRNWIEQDQSNSCFIPPGNYPALFAEMDPGELAQARAQIQNMKLPVLLQQDDDGDLYLHLVVAQGLRPLAYAAAEVLRNYGKLDVKEHRGKTPLLVAAAANQPEIVKDLIMLGADVNAVDQKGQTVLHLGATYGLPRVIEAVIVTSIAVNVEARNYEGLTPLHCAVIAYNAAFQAENTEMLPQHHMQDFLLCIQLLLYLGADYKSQDLKSSKTILHLAVQAGNLPLIQILLQLSERELQNFVNMKAHGNTALHMAAGLHHHRFQEDIVRLLLQHWADPSIRNLENEQPVHLLAPGPEAEQFVASFCDCIVLYALKEAGSHGRSTVAT